MQTPLEGSPDKIAAESKELLERFEQKAKETPMSLENVFVLLQETYKEGDVTFSEKSTARSQVTCNLALCGSEYQRIKFVNHMELEDWKFDGFDNNNDRLV